MLYIYCTRIYEKLNLIIINNNIIFVIYQKMEETNERKKVKNRKSKRLQRFRSFSHFSNARLLQFMASMWKERIHKIRMKCALAYAST